MPGRRDRATAGVPRRNWTSGDGAPTSQRNWGWLVCAPSPVCDEAPRPPSSGRIDVVEESGGTVRARRAGQGRRPAGAVERRARPARPGRPGRRRSGDPRLVVGLSGMVEELQRLEPSAERSAWVMQPRYFYDPEEPGVELSRAAQARGVQTQLMVPPSTVQHPPAAAVDLPDHPARAGLHPGDDRRRAADAGGRRDTADGQRTSWYTARPDVVRRCSTCGSARWRCRPRSCRRAPSRRCRCDSSRCPG